MDENPVVPRSPSSSLRLRKVAAWPGIRVLAWDDNFLYGSCGYQVVRLDASQQVDHNSEWSPLARFNPRGWRKLTSRSTLGYRLVRDGFHALTISNGATHKPSLVGAVAGAIVVCPPDTHQFHVTHTIRRGTRPLHITAVPAGNIYWGEYFDNRERAAVHIYASTDSGSTWQIGYTFPPGSIRHIHNIVYDRWADCLWILTGDNGAECKVLRASCDLSSVETVLSGSQQARAVVLLPARDRLYLSTDTPSEKNHVYRLDRAGQLERVGDLSSSSICGCQVSSPTREIASESHREAMFFSTMVEPSTANPTREVHLVGSIDGIEWPVLARWTKDRLSMRFFQYGNAFLPDGENRTCYLAATTIAVQNDDLVTTLWEVVVA